MDLYPGSNGSYPKTWTQWSFHSVLVLPPSPLLPAQQRFQPVKQTHTDQKWSWNLLRFGFWSQHRITLKWKIDRLDKKISEIFDNIREDSAHGNSFWVASTFWVPWTQRSEFMSRGLACQVPVAVKKKACCYLNMHFCTHPLLACFHTLIRRKKGSQKVANHSLLVLAK
jgi:hypothetical protein